VPLKDRFYIYRGKVLHQKKAAADFDEMYWQMKGQQKAKMKVLPGNA
jgi:hypothetical protein